VYIPGGYSPTAAASFLPSAEQATEAHPDGCENPGLFVVQVAPELAETMTGRFDIVATRTAPSAEEAIEV
jgi:hypothetical protein